MIAEAGAPTLPPTGSEVRLAELVAALALATDLATGQPLEHGLRRTLLAVWLGQEIGLGQDEMGSAYYVALLGSVGCILDSAAFADFVSDEIAMSEQLMTVDPSRQLSVAAFFLRHIGAGDPPLRRLHKVLSVSRQSQAVCRDVALHVGGLLDLGPAIKEALGQCDELWDGSGPALGLKGEDIHVAARLFLLCNDIEVFNRIGGSETAIAVVRKRAGKVYDPHIARRFEEVGKRLLTRLQSEPAWDAVLAVEPEPVRFMSQPEFDAVARKIANFVDMRTPVTVGHSAGVASLAEGAARVLGLPDRDVTTQRRAGLLHDLGRAGVPVSVWNKTEPLCEDDWHRIRRHPSLTELVLARSTGLGHLGTLAGLHHEKLDGSGYRGLAAGSLPINASILAVADAYQTKLESRPHRQALTPERASDELSKQATQGKLDRHVVDAILTTAGQQPRPEKRRRNLPAGLSEREAEVLSLTVRGMSNRQIAEALVVSPKTAGHHLENIYAKIGVSSRVGATLFALQHGLTENSARA
ncbi:MAG TPA: HD domain-containing phosphohydrolase [Chloroflexota bacterium]